MMFERWGFRVLSGLSIWLVSVFCLVAVSWGAPFLVCDPPTAEEQGVITYYLITGIPEYEGQHIPIDSSRTFGFTLDLAGLPYGSYTVTAMACDMWDCSAASDPLVLKKIQKEKPSGLFIIPKLPK